MADERARRILYGSLALIGPRGERSHLVYAEDNALFRWVSVELGVPRARLHDLRHLHAALAIREGMDPRVSAERLGHAKASFTMNVYTCLFEEHKGEKHRKLNELLN